MIYEIKMMSGQEIPLKDEEALKKLLEASKKGGLVLTDYGVVNISSIDSIIPYKKKMAEVNELLEMGIEKDFDGAFDRVCGVSPFAKLLSGKMTMLSNKSRTEAQEEAAHNERKLN